ncbi:ImmA/IrrE family metallo-endopeptidase [Auritidibacter ignavus]|uniref:ImmA/IrrE family metallo-endopeptidase n=1 Tax=Auritidibacter ignavus TaxID=678932 RepID=UPI00244D20B4|nr:ImmA/IrrE family metallo-endopeptidase [Auritidibacter ignavus]WGH80627.1 ImmA/IrrE family metallo-endopeptidase [Auritidibacter ignavus]
MFHPWQELCHLDHVIVEWMRPHPMIPAATDGERCIWLDPRMNQVERRCALTHELVHLEFGHVGCQPAGVERGVRVETARRLITVEQLAEWVPWALSFEELASELWVTEMVLADRVDNLNADERPVLGGVDFLYGY